jgi:phenylacetate-CoA ligase
MSHVDRNSGILQPEEKLSTEERHAYQERFLQEVVTHSYRSGTPLKNVMDAAGLSTADIRTIDDLRKIPITKKTHLAEAQKENPPFGGFLTVPVSDLARIHRSPGPIYDPVGKVPDYWRWKTALYAAGFRPGDLVVNTLAYHLTPAGHMFEEGLSELGATIVPTGVGNTETQVDVIDRLRVTGYIGTPSFLSTILKKAELMGVAFGNSCPLEVAFLLAEMLPESLRARFEEEYRIIGRQAYGTADVGCVSYECPQLDGMHIHYDAIVEIVDPASGQVVPEGDPGEVVVTRNNMIYPLVRFGTGDLSSIVTDTCPCGRTGPRLTRIMGRVDQLTKVKGMFVHPSQVQKVLAAHPVIRKGRLLVDRVGDQDVMTLEVELAGEPGRNFIPAVESMIHEAIKLKGGVKILEPGTLGEEDKIIHDVRTWD